MFFLPLLLKCYLLKTKQNKTKNSRSLQHSESGCVQSQGTESQFGSPAHSTEARLLLALHEDSLMRLCAQCRARGGSLSCWVAWLPILPLRLGLWQLLTTWRSSSGNVDHPSYCRKHPQGHTLLWEEGSEMGRACCL